MWAPFEDVMRRRWLPDITNMQDIPESLTESGMAPYCNNMVIGSGQNKN